MSVHARMLRLLEAKPDSTSSLKAEAVALLKQCQKVLPEILSLQKDLNAMHERLVALDREGKVPNVPPFTGKSAWESVSFSVNKGAYEHALEWARRIEKEWS